MLLIKKFLLFLNSFGILGKTFLTWQEWLNGNANIQAKVGRLRDMVSDDDTSCRVLCVNCSVSKATTNATVFQPFLAGSTSGCFKAVPGTSKSPIHIDKRGGCGVAAIAWELIFEWIYLQVLCIYCLCCYMRTKIGVIKVMRTYMPQRFKRNQWQYITHCCVFQV